MSSVPDTVFVETKQYEFFREFCDACLQNCYIGLCYGPPGVGKTLSARHYANWDKVGSYQTKLSPCDFTLNQIAGSNVVFYTAQVVNSAGRIDSDINLLRNRLRSLVVQDIASKREPALEEAKQRIKEAQNDYILNGNRFSDKRDNSFERLEADHLKLTIEYSRQCTHAKDPTKLIIVDEADRLKMVSLDQLRAVFDRGGIGLILIGMPGLEKRLARYPQLYSRVGFVHEFRPLPATETRRLLQDHWRPPGISSPLAGLSDEETLAAILRVTGGNFRLLHRLLTQISRVLEINELDRVTPPVVEAARESLVIGVK
jgi:DNA transposition AAA+ family ATPase